ncbi:flagellar brake protein [Fuchsiella alkaliacetigena]|uniref:flagellar brake protein n=1 Tax=Fuchsiella alkaliacetigena TaxID=957042 RepID=UPI00200AF241|nr:PilZ domain-containing protein [Fuchsiella alkaliacetigena]MCK8824423.1 PilZ domain-containing protein [Fuchsiella alkaliacetigena]
MHTSQFVNKRVKLREPDVDFTDLSAAIKGQVTEKEDDELSIKLKKELDSGIKDVIQVIYVNNAKGIHYFNGRITTIGGDRKLIKVRCPEKAQKHQRRQAVRVKYKTEVEFSPVSYQGKNLTHLEDKKGTGQMIDISAGGICFSSDIKLLKDLVVELSFNLEEEPYQVLGEIVRIIETEEGYEMGVKFHHNLKSVENNISNFVLQQQLRNRRQKAGN